MLPQQFDDSYYINQVIAGRIDQFEPLLRRYNQRLYRVARAIVGDGGNAEDVVQTAYLSAFTKLHQFSGESAFSTWLTRIVINEALTNKRRVKGPVYSEESEKRVGARACDKSPEDEAMRHEYSAIIDDAIENLPETYRVVFVMREIQEISTNETAACLNLTEDLVKVRLYRAKKLLQESLKDNVDRTSGDAFIFLGAQCNRLVDAVLKRIEPTSAPQS